MPAVSPRERRYDERQARILEAALALIADGGIEAVSMARLADAVDLTPAALYRYVASKDQLLARLVERVLDDLRAHLADARAAAPAGTPALVHVGRALAAYMTFARLQPQRFGLLAMTMASPKVLLTEPKDAQALVTRMLGTLAVLVEALSAAVADRTLALGNPAERAVCLFGVAHGLLMLRKQAPHAPAVLDLPRLVAAGARGMLLSWGASPDHVDAALAPVLATTIP